LELYQQCRSRLEGPEIPDECSTDEDCARAGCSSEVCTTRAAASEVMTTCEVLPCFQAVEACGCVEGRCRWSLADAMPSLEPLPAPRP